MLFLNKKFFCFLFFFSVGLSVLGAQDNQTQKGYDSLVSLFYDWREFESPPLLNGAPNYTKKSFQKRQVKFKELRARLKKIDISGWDKSQSIDFKIAWFS